MKLKHFLLLFTLFLGNLTFAQTFDPLPGETPKVLKPNKRNSTAPQAVNNWGEDLLLPDALKAEVAAKCTNKVDVKIFDTSAGSDHTYLSKGQRTGTNYCQPPGSTLDANGHSTHVMGIIAAKEFGLCDALVQNGLVTFKPVKVLGDNGGGSFQWLADAIVAEDVENRQLLNAKTFVVCNMSLGGGTAKVTVVENALKNSRDLGVIYCVASGNTSQFGVNYPGNSQYVLATAAIGQDLKRASFSTFGPEVQNAQPGVAINSTYPGQRFASMSGTSMATPFQSALCAIALSRWGAPLANVDVMRNYMAWVSTDIPPTGKDQETGWGYTLVRNILDKDPKNMPNKPNDPNPVDPPKPPVHVARNLIHTIEGQFPIYWSIAGNGSTKTDVTLKTKEELTQLGEVLTVTKLEVRSNATTQFADEAWKKTNDEVKWFFTNRGLNLNTGMDFGDATYWTAYFFDLLAKNRNFNLDVLRIEAVDAKGNKVVYDSSNLQKV